MNWTRRDFVALAAGAPLAASQGSGKPSLCIFSKHMANLNYEQLGKTSREMGFDGVDLTVRAKSHVLPERAEEDMPRAVEAIRSHGVTVPMITTNILRPDEPTTRPILSTASRLKIPLYKPGYWLYRTPAVLDTLQQVKKATEGLVQMGKEYGIVSGFHNHSGNYVGTAIWDLRDIIKDLDPAWIGYYFDPAHATIEGGSFNWILSARIALPRLKMVALKDFYWEKSGGRWRVKWCPLGEGMVDWGRFFTMLAESRFTGPISLHVEYEPADEPAAIAKDLEFMKAQVAKAYK